MTSLEMRTNNRIVEINGETYRLDFDNLALSFAEQVYLTVYGRKANVAIITEELYEMSMTALMAFTYGAMRSAGEKMAWEQFSKNIFTYKNFSKLFDVVLDAIEALMTPDDGRPTVTTTNEKN